ncbi:uncharacterized protein LOC132572217 [Heteronotia binoei]|uniref:uncharacterized protein LOC132572217 n=1 Tax=Heteronotia binoei TaxID=13085 RepID=UPI00292D74F0|nr:uncharacterized protein LOC132572217 [Heteronotia binoei]
MEFTQTSPSLEDPIESPLEGPEESIHREQPLGNPRTKEMPQAGQDFLLSETAKLRNLINQMSQLLKMAESRLSSLEARVCGSQQTNSVMLASQSDSTGVSAASSPSFSSPQMILDAAQTTVSPRSAFAYTGGAPIEPVSLSSPGRFRTAPSTRAYCGTEKKDHPVLPDDWLTETTSKSEAALIKAEESDEQKALSLNAPECKIEPQTLMSTKETDLPVITAIWSLKRTSESETAPREAEESDNQEDTSPRTSPLIVPKCETEPQTLTCTYETALPMIAAGESQEEIAESKTAHTETEEFDQQENNFSEGSAQAYQPQPFMRTLPDTPQLTALDAMQKEAPGRATELSRRCSTNNTPNSTALTGTTTNPMTPSCLPSSPLGEVRPPTKCQQTSIAWLYFTKQSKFIATCRVCEEDVEMVKIGASGPVGTAALLRHLKREHGIPSIAWKHFTKQSTFIATCRICKENVKVGKIGGWGNVDTAALLSHLKQKHRIHQKKVAPPALPGALTKTQDMERPSSTEKPRRTTSSALTCTNTSPATLSCLLSSPPAEERPATKCRQTSFAWLYFTKQSKLKATCRVCEGDVKAGKPRAFGSMRTAPLLRHLKREHGIPSIAWKHFTKESTFIATCRVCKQNVKIGEIGGCGDVDTTALLSHLKCEHGIHQKKVAPPVLHAALSKTQNLERLSTIERPRRTTSSASTCTTTSPAILNCFLSPPPVEMRPATKCRQTSIAWLYFTKRSKLMATCRVCEGDVKAGKPRASGNMRTAPLLRHLKREHGIPPTAWKHFTKLSMSIATCKVCKENVKVGKTGGCGNVDTAALLSHLKCEHGIPQEKVGPSALPGALTKTQDMERPSTIEKLRRTTSNALTCTTTSPAILNCFLSPPPAEVRPATKHQQTSIAWLYFTKRSKLVATCKVCEGDVKAGKKRATGNMSTAPLLNHLKREHGIPCIAWKHFTKESTFIATCRICKEKVNVGEIGGCSNVGTAALLSHLKCEHGIQQQKVTPPALPAALTKTQDVERPSIIERPRRTMSAVSTCTTTSPMTLSCLPSSPLEEARPPTKCRQTSIAWLYFTKRSKLIATCRVCEGDVKGGKTTASGNMRTAPLLKHLKCKHGIPSVAWKFFTMRSQFTAVCRVCEEDVKTGQTEDCSNVDTAALLSHLKCEHGIHQKKVAPPALPAALTKTQDMERPSIIEKPSRTSSSASTCTTTSPSTLNCVPSSPPADVRPPTKCQQTSIAWLYFTKQSKFIATCRVCEGDVKAGKPRASDNMRTAPLLRHLNREHGIPSIAWKFFTMHSQFTAMCRICDEEVKTGKTGGCDNVDTAVLLSHLKCEHGIHQEKVAPSALPGAGLKIQNAEKPSNIERPSRTSAAVSTCATTSPGTLSCLPSSPSAEVRLPTKRRQTSIAWLYFRKRSKFIATCSLCEDNVKTGKPGGCSNVGTAALLSHLKRKHGIPSIAWLYFTMQSKCTATCSICKEDVNTGKTGSCGNMGTMVLLLHLKYKHGIHQEKVAPSAVPGASSKIHDMEGPSTIENPSRTTSAVSG